jgi:hypothetical protein
MIEPKALYPASVKQLSSAVQVYEHHSAWEDERRASVDPQLRDWPNQDG